MNKAKLGDWDIMAIKDHLKHYPKCQITNRGVDSSVPVYSIFGGVSILNKPEISCRDDVYEQVLKLTNS